MMNWLEGEAGKDWIAWQEKMAYREGGVFQWLVFFVCLVVQGQLYFSIFDDKVFV